MEGLATQNGKEQAALWDKSLSSSKHLPSSLLLLPMAGQQESWRKPKTSGNLHGAPPQAILPHAWGDKPETQSNRGPRARSVHLDSPCPAPGTWRPTCPMHPNMWQPPGQAMGSITTLRHQPLPDKRPGQCLPNERMAESRGRVYREGKDISPPSATCSPHTKEIPSSTPEVATPQGSRWRGAPIAPRGLECPTADRTPAGRTGEAKLSNGTNLA